MSTERGRQITERRAALQARIAGDRRALGEAVGDVQASVAVVDRVVGVVQRLRQRPVALAIGSGLVLAVVVGRYRAIRWVLRGLALAAAARQMGGVVRELADNLPDKPAGERHSR